MTTAPPQIEGLALTELLGGGEHYEVWRAHDDDLLCPVVVKIMRQQAAEHDWLREMFRGEVDVLASLAHPSIVRLLAHDSSAPRPYMVLVDAQGSTLSGSIGRHGALEEHPLILMANDIAAAIQYLHARQMVHLDIKPSNIQLGAPAVLLDMSLARTVEEAAQLTVPVGTDQYMAPEQIHPGVDNPVGPASDIWGFGASLFRAAAGFRPWPSEPRWAQVDSPARALPKHVPAGLAEIIMACLVPEAAKRPSARDIALACGDLMEHLPTAPRLAGFSLKPQSTR